MTTNTVITNWKNGTTEFECISPNGVKTVLGTSTENNKIAPPKAMMLSSLAVCSGLDIVAILVKMRVELENFKINTVASLTEEHPKYYDEVKVQYQFFGKDLDKEKIENAPNLSLTRYCGAWKCLAGFQNSSPK